MSLRRKLITSIGGLVVILLALIQLFGYFGARRFALSELEHEGGLLARYQAERVRASLNYAESMSEFLLRVIALDEPEKSAPHLERLLEDLLNGNQQISAVEIHRRSGKALAVRRTHEGHISWGAPTFRVPKTSKVERRGRWILPQADPAATHLHYLQTVDGVTVVVEVPVRLLAAPLEQTEGTVAYGFLATGAVVLFTNSSDPSNRVAERLRFITDILMARDQKGDFFQVEDPIYGKSAWVGTAPVGDLDLTVGVVYLEGRNFRPLYGLAWGTVGVGTLGIVLLLVAISLTARSVSRPLVELSHTVDTAIASGFSERVCVPGQATLEVERLAVSFNRMFDDLKDHIGRLEEAAQDRQAMESELSIAADIQGSMLPKFPFQGRHWEAVGISWAAQKVGGDFVSVFPVGADRLGFFIGDVSGKGVPGAITMAFTASLLEHLGRVGLAPEECLRAVNRALCARNEPTSFVTAFFGVLDIEGLVSYGNAGHHPPLLFHGPADLHSPEVESGLALGIFEEAVFGTGSFQLDPAERLLLYTDGVIEAMNKKKDEYGEQRLEALLQAFCPEQTLSEQLSRLCRSVEDFRDGAPPNDDLTVFLMRRVDRRSES